MSEEYDSEKLKVKAERIKKFSLVLLGFIQRLKEKIFIILGVLALIIGIILELMGYGAVVEGLIIAFGFFLIQAHVDTQKEIRSGNEKITESMKEDLRGNTDRIIAAIERKK